MGLTQLGPPAASYQRPESGRSSGTPLWEIGPLGVSAGCDGPVGGVAASDLAVAVVEAAAASAGESVTEDDAGEVVGLVLEAAGQLPGAGQFGGLAVLVLPAADRQIRAGELGVATGEGQAAFIPGLQMAVGLRNCLHWAWVGCGGCVACLTLPTWFAVLICPAWSTRTSPSSRQQQPRLPGRAHSLTVWFITRGAVDDREGAQPDQRAAAP